MRTMRVSLSLGGLGLGAVLLVAASPRHGDRAGALFAAFGDLEVPVQAVGHVPAASTRGPVVLTLGFAELPLDHLTRRPEPPTGAAGAGVAVGGMSGVAVAEPAARPVRASRLAVEVVRRFQPLDRFDAWLAIDENTITDRLSCEKPRILGAQGVGRVVVQVQCTRIAIEDRPGGAVFPHWVTDTTGVPPTPDRLEFTPGSAVLSPAAIARLRLLLALLARQKELSLLVAGFAEVGDRDPAAVAAQRAAAARDYLVGNGVARNRLTTVSYGAERPLEPDDIGQAWTHNRRVHLTILTGAAQ